jgi:hypothetical protein
MQLATVFEWMTTNKLSKLSVDFNGEGDSGDFDDYVSIEYTNPSSDYTTEDYSRLQGELETYKPTLGGVNKEGGNERTLKQLILSLARAIEQETEHGVDWWNNDGGNGQVEFITDDVGNDGNTYHHGVCLTVNARVIEYETTYHTIQGMVGPAEATTE